MDFSKFNKITTLIFDVDGVFTNSNLLITETGEMLRTVSTRDGEGVKQAIKAGYTIAIITGGTSRGIPIRFNYLGVELVYDCVKDKTVVLKEIINKLGISTEEILYMGDDLPDLAVMAMVGLSACPSDAAIDVIDKADFVSTFKGGHACVRDVIETTMRIQEKWLVA